jgi:hypothetical protein
LNKRDLLKTTVVVAGSAAAAFSVQAQHAPRTISGPVLLTVSGLIGTGNRGPLDPALDQMLVKQKVGFSKAHCFDFNGLVAMPSTSIRTTLEYDGKAHTLKGPLLSEVIKATGAVPHDKMSALLRAVDGYAVLLSTSEIVQRRFILATHLDGRPMALGGLGPLWAVYEADKFPDLMAKPLNERYSLCPWATYHIELKEG